MKVKLGVALGLLIVFACKTDPKKLDPVDTKELDIIEKIAFAHGYENWSKVNEIAFTFNVDKDSSHFERRWIWQPKTNTITSISGGDTLTYNRKTMDSIAYKTNAGFINDRYWLVAPFNLMWDRNNFEFEHSTNTESPMAKQSMQKLTIVYGNEGGYTPGDAYDFYFGEDYIIKEWVFRKANQVEPSMTTTWENHKNYNGILIAKDHKKQDEIFNLFFDDIVIK